MTVPDVREVAVRARIADLERRFGDPADPANPLGSERFLAACARGTPLAGAERMLDAFGLNAEFVPRELGGRLDRLDRLGRVMRAVFRRDASLGLGYGMTSFLAAVVVWSAGTGEQQRAVAALLLGGGRIGSAYPEFSRGNVFLRNELTARPHRGAFLLNGSKEAVNNVGRAARLVVFAGTPDHGPGSHTAFLLDLSVLPHGSYRLLSRHRTTGVRGCLVGGIEFTDCPVPATAVLGPVGEGTRLAGRAFRITRAAGPSMALGCADTALRTAVAFARTQRSGSRPALETSRDRAALTGAFTDLLTADCLALVGARAAHLLPGESPLHAAVVKYLLPKMLTETVYDLSVVLGSESYSTTGVYGAFAKNIRDLPMIGLGHAGTAACLATIVPQLRRLAGPADRGQPEPPAALFRIEDDRATPAIRWDAPAPGPSTGPDPDVLTASLESLARSAPHTGAGDHRALLATLAGALVAELRRLRDRYRQAGTAGGEPFDAGSCALADRYALVLAGAACLGVWRYGAGSAQGGPGFLGEPAWLVSALLRILRRLGVPVAALPRAAEDRLLHEVLSRFEEGRSYDLYRTPLSC